MQVSVWKFTRALLQETTTWVFAILGLISTILQFFVPFIAPNFNLPDTLIPIVTIGIYTAGLFLSTYKIYTNLTKQNQELQDEIQKQKNITSKTNITLENIEGIEYTFTVRSSSLISIEGLRKQYSDIEQEFDKYNRIIQNTNKTEQEKTELIQKLSVKREKGRETLDKQIKKAREINGYEFPYPVITLHLRLVNRGDAKGTLISISTEKLVFDELSLSFSTSKVINIADMPMEISPNSQLNIIIEMAGKCDLDIVRFADRLRMFETPSDTSIVQTSITVEYRDHDNITRSVIKKIPISLRPLRDQYGVFWYREGFTKFTELSNFIYSDYVEQSVSVKSLYPFSTPTPLNHD